MNDGLSYHCRADCCGVCSDPKCTCPHHARTLSRTTKKLYAEHEKRYFLDDVNRQAWLKEQLAKVEGTWLREDWLKNSEPIIQQLARLEMMRRPPLMALNPVTGDVSIVPEEQPEPLRRFEAVLNEMLKTMWEKLCDAHGLPDLKDAMQNPPVIR